MYPHCVLKTTHLSFYYNFCYSGLIFKIFKILKIFHWRVFLEHSLINTFISFNLNAYYLAKFECLNCRQILIQEVKNKCV